MENLIGTGCMWTGPWPAECLGEVIMTRLWTEGGGFGDSDWKRCFHSTGYHCQ